jgi:hypothetical protein
MFYFWYFTSIIFQQFLNNYRILILFIESFSLLFFIFFMMKKHTLYVGVVFFLTGLLRSTLSIYNIDQSVENDGVYYFHGNINSLSQYGSIINKVSLKKVPQSFDKIVSCLDKKKSKRSYDYFSYKNFCTLMFDKNNIETQIEKKRNNIGDAYLTFPKYMTFKNKIELWKKGSISGVCTFKKSKKIFKIPKLVLVSFLMKTINIFVLIIFKIIKKKYMNILI